MKRFSVSYVLISESLPSIVDFKAISRPVLPATAQQFIHRAAVQLGQLRQPLGGGEIRAVLPIVDVLEGNAEGKRHVLRREPGPLPCFFQPYFYLLINNKLRLTLRRKPFNIGSANNLQFFSKPAV